jgi:tetratricopeptide (TPR) repeat protein
LQPIALITLAALLATPLVLAAPPQSAATAAAQSQTEPNRSNAYYHYGLAHLYEEMAISAGRQDYATQAVEEYKKALNADPDSALLQDGLAGLYFKIGRIKDAVSAAQDQVKSNPNDLAAHTLLGQVYLRSLGDMHGAQASEMLQHAIAEYETITRLKPNDMESKLLLGQLYALNNDHAKAEVQFKAAQKIDGSNEEVVLRMATLYREEGGVQRAIDTLSAVPATDRTAHLEFELGSCFDEIKKPKEAAAAYARSLEIEPDNPDAERAMAAALLTDGQLDEALKAFNVLLAADANDAQSEIRIAEIERRQGHYDIALATLEKAKSLVQDSHELSMELNYDEALNYDAMGKYDQAVGVLTKILESSERADGKYTDGEKQNRALLLDRVGIIDREEGKTSEAVAAYKQMVDFGGDCGATITDESAHPCYAERGFDGEIDAYRDTHQWKEATSTAAEAAKALPKDRLMQLTYAGQLVDMGQVDQGLTLAKAQISGTAEDRDAVEALAQIYIRLKRFTDASEQLEKADALAIKPEEKLYAYFLRGEMYDRQKMYDKAEAEFRKALAIDAQNAGVLNYLGYMLADQGMRLPEAMKLIRQAVELEPQNGAYLDSLGWVCFKSGLYAEAEENLHKANERMNSDPTVHDHLGEVYEKTGRLKLAVAQWERSMTEYAHSLAADADPEDVQKVQRKLENARVKLAKLSATSDQNTK